ncbi:hypothetical protein V8F33_004648 [Rhypophila sp. PSN 637]
MAYLTLGGKGGNMSLSAMLKDGTTINLTVTSPDGSTPHISASTSNSQDSISIDICSLHDHPEHPTDSHRRPSAKPAAKHDEMTSTTLPSDIVAVQSGNLGYLFYVNSKNDLAYLREEREEEAGNVEFKVDRVKNSEHERIKVNPNVKQLAAISWNSWGKREIRVYYADPEGTLSEYCLTKAGDEYGPEQDWYKGDLGKKNKLKVKAGSSLSATLIRNADNSPIGIRVYASSTSTDTNAEGVEPISVFKYNFPPQGKTATWREPDIITSNVNFY